MLYTMWLLIGILLAIPFLLVARRRGIQGELTLLALGLIGAAIIYIGFAAAWGDALWLATEIGGLLLYGGFVLLAWRSATLWLAVGWAAHSIWDIALHWIGPGHSVAPEWYVFACLSFDLLVAGYVLTRLNIWNNGIPRTDFGRS